MITRLRGVGGAEEVVVSDWVIDATGERRGLLGAGEGSGSDEDRDPLLTGLGVEWLLQVPERTWQRWQDRLSFCLGSDWLPQGYGWVFPMQPGVLKIGICRYRDPRHPQPPLSPLLERLLERLLEPKELAQLKVLDRHGGRVRSRIRRLEPHRRGRLVGLGDVVSTANLLGGEGIRHALTSSAVLAPLLLESLRASPRGRRGADPVRHYPERLRRSLGWRWTLSGRVARRTWLGLRDAAGDRRLLRILESLESCRAEDLSALLFDYRFERYGLRVLPYLLGLR